MESQEIPDTRSRRVMRFSFVANPALQEELQQQLTEQGRQTTPLRIYASRQLVITVDEAMRRQDALRNIAKNFHSYYEPIHIQPSLRSREINETVTRFQLLPKDQASFDSMTSLDVKPDERFENYDPIARAEQLHNLVESQPLIGHYMFIDIATQALRSVSERQKASRIFVQKVPTGRFWLNTQALSMVRDIRYADATSVPLPAPVPKSIHVPERIRTMVADPAIDEDLALEQAILDRLPGTPDELPEAI